MKKIAAFFAVCLILFSASDIFSQQDITKSWEGSLNVSGNVIRVILHITRDKDGNLGGTADSPDQGGKDIPLTSVTLNGSDIRIEAASINGIITGTVNEDFTRIKGELTQNNNTIPINFTPMDAGSNEVNSAAALNDSTFWQGKINAMGQELTFISKFYKINNDSIKGFIDSPDQGAKDIPLSFVYLGDDSVRFDCPSVGGYYSGKFVDNNSKIDGKWYQGGMAFPLLLSQVNTVKTIAHPQEPTKPYPYNDEEVTFENKQAGITLAGTFTYPKEGKNFPAVVLVSGSGPENRDEEIFGQKPFLVWSDYLTRNGIAVLRFDDRGVGGSTGNSANATTLDFVTDALSAVNYLKTRKEVNIKKIGIVGHSEGGLIAPIAANKSSDVSFIVLVAGPAVPGKDILLLQNELIYKSMGIDENKIKEDTRILSNVYNIVVTSPDSITASARIDSMINAYLSGLTVEEKNKPENSKMVFEQRKNQILSPWFRFFLAYNPQDALKKLKIPVLALFGSKDIQVPASQNKSEMEKALKKSKSPQYKVVELPGVNHLFQECKTGAISEYANIEQTTSPAMLELMSGWIKKITR